MDANASKKTIRSVLLVMLFCYFPQLLSSPWWLSALIVGIIGYRLVTDYYNLPMPNLWGRSLLVLASVGLLFLHYRVLVSRGFYSGILLTFVALKSLEIRTLRDLRVLLLCNFYIMLTVLLIHQELWVFMYSIVAVALNLLLMMMLTAPLVDFQHGGKRLIKGILFALPFSLLLFYLFPRLSTPLWRVPALSQTKTGFSEEMTTGNLSEVFSDDSTVMRVSFKRKFKASLYWRGLVLSEYNGLSWKPDTANEPPFEKLRPIGASEPQSYEILLEPHQKKWLFYQDNPIAAYPSLLFSSSKGLVQENNSVVYQRVAYSIIDKPVVETSIISNALYQQNTELPLHGNPRIRAFAKEQFAAVNGKTDAMINAIGRYIHEQPYWYSLTPVNTGVKPNVIDEFWFETKRGYCEYYTSAVAIILRSVGIPARVILGYHGGHWNPFAEYLTVQQNDAHAWLEYWTEGLGWQRMDPVTYISATRIDPVIHQKQAGGVEAAWFSGWNQINAKLPWTLRAAYLLESAQFFWERWLLFYNQDSQRELLKKIGVAQWDAILLLQLFIAVIVLLLLASALWYLMQQRLRRDSLLVEYHCLQREMRRLGVQTKPPTTFSQQLHELGYKKPHLKGFLCQHAIQYEQLRLHHVDETLQQRKLILQLLRTLRIKLKNIPVI